LKVIIEVNRDIQLLAYRDDERLSMGKENGFLVRMGFGLHAGWAIEGAVGSLQKVDATYLSPHVNMAARMEVATRQFGVSLLMTRSFHKVSTRPTELLADLILKLEPALRIIANPRYNTTSYSCFQSRPKTSAERSMLSQ